MSMALISKVRSVGRGGVGTSMVIGEGERAIVKYFQSMYNSVNTGKRGSQFACTRVMRCLHGLLSRYLRAEYLQVVSVSGEEVGKIKGGAHFPCNKPCISSINPWATPSWVRDSQSCVSSGPSSVQLEGGSAIRLPLNSDKIRWLSSLSPGC